MSQFTVSDHELADINVQPVPAPVPAPAPAAQQQATLPPAAAPAAVAATPAAAGDPDEDIPNTSLEPKPQAGKSGTATDWDDEELLTMGDGFSRIRVEKGSSKTIRFSILPFLPPQKGRSHFVSTKDVKGNRMCLATKNTVGYCCQKLEEEGRFHATVLALEYTNADPKSGGYKKDSNGRLPVIEWRIGYVDLSKANFRTVRVLAEEDTVISDYDLVMKLDGNHYQFAVKSRSALWKQNAAFAAEVEAACQKYVVDGGKKLASKLGKKMTLIEWKALLATMGGGAAEATLDDMEEI